MRDDEKRPEVPDIGSRADDELSQYGDEQDMPVRRRRSAKATGKKKKSQKKTAAKKTAATSKAAAKKPSTRKASSESAGK